MRIRPTARLYNGLCLRSKCTQRYLTREHRPEIQAALGRVAQLAEEVASSRRTALTGAPADLRDADYYEFPSFYKGTNGDSRGFCNWLIRDLLIIGKYPFCDPVGAPNLKESTDHLRRLLDAGVTSFVSLQAEVPPQNAPEAWPAEGMPIFARRPMQTFSPYGPTLLEEATALRRQAPEFLHFPIQDVSIPTWEGLLEIVESVLQALNRPGGLAYVHCWAGLGRAGLVGASVLAALRPHLAAEEVLLCTQAGYDSRGPGRAQSPQTWQQRALVREFTQRLREQTAPQPFQAEVQTSSPPFLPRLFELAP